MTQSINHRLALIFIVAITLSACEPVPQPLNPDTDATFGIHPVLHNADGSPMTTLPAGMELGDDVQMFRDERGKPIFIAQPAVVDENCLDSMEAITDHYGEPALAFNLDNRCARIFGSYTAQNVSKRMALMLNGDLVSAPYIRTAITGGSGLIEGSFSSLAEAEAVAKTFD